MDDNFLKMRPYFIMGILNTTPDSFSDGGNFTTVDLALKRALEMVDEGADIIDIGGESSRPGAEAVSEDEELSRVIPVIEKISKYTDTPISIDTVKSKVAQAALDAGAFMVNDITAGRRDAKMASVVAENSCFVTLMHSRKKPDNMQDSPFYTDVISEVSRELIDSVEVFRAAGVAADKIILDPGIGFAKRVEDNIDILANIDKFMMLGYEILIGTSRKSFIGLLTGEKAPEKRVSGSLGSIAYAFMQGANFFRVHDVKTTSDYLKVLSEIGARIE